MGLTTLLQLFLGSWGARRLPGRPGGPPGRPARPARVTPGNRVRLRMPIASSHTVWIPAGAAGIVVTGDPRARTVRVELDRPRTVVTVPWSWVEDEPEPKPAPDPSA